MGCFNVFHFLTFPFSLLLPIDPSNRPPNTILLFPHYIYVYICIYMIIYVKYTVFSKIFLVLLLPQNHRRDTKYLLVMNTQHCHVVCWFQSLSVVYYSFVHYMLFYNYIMCLSFFVCLFCSTGAWTQGLHFEPFCQPFVAKGFFQDRVSQNYLSWLPSNCILLISASWVARITGMSHWCPAMLPIFVFNVYSIFIWCVWGDGEWWKHPKW
jgi:hypothetical protein